MQSAQSNDLRLREMRRRDEQAQSLQDFRRRNEPFLNSPYDLDGLQQMYNRAAASGNIAVMDYYGARLAAARNAGGPRSRLTQKPLGGACKKTLTPWRAKNLGSMCSGSSIREK